MEQKIYELTQEDQEKAISYSIVSGFSSFDKTKRTMKCRLDEYCFWERLSIDKAKYNALKIPPTIGGHAITNIGKRCFKCYAMTDTVILPDTIDFIEEDAFEDSNITNITIPKNVVAIGENAFCWCANLTSVTFMNGDIYISGIYDPGKQEDWYICSHKYRYLFDTSNLKEINVLNDEISVDLALIIITYDLAYPQNNIQIKPNYFTVIDNVILKHFLFEYQKLEQAEKVAMILNEFNRRQRNLVPVIEEI